MIWHWDHLVTALPGSPPSRVQVSVAKAFSPLNILDLQKDVGLATRMSLISVSGIPVHHDLRHHLPWIDVPKKTLEDEVLPHDMQSSLYVPSRPLLPQFHLQKSNQPPSSNDTASMLLEPKRWRSFSE